MCMNKLRDAFIYLIYTLGEVILVPIEMSSGFVNRMASHRPVNIPGTPNNATVIALHK